MTDPALPDQVDPLEKKKKQDPVYQHCFTISWMLLKKKILTSLYALVLQLLLWLVMRLSWKGLLCHLQNRDILSPFTDVFCNYEGLLES